MTTATGTGVVGDASIAELQSTLRGSVIRPADPSYDEARAVWNAAHDRHPAVIVGCTGTADVLRAVEFARSQGMLVAIRGGAHSVAGFSTCDGGMVIDLSPMRGVRVDPERRRAVVQAGATWADVDHETQAFGLAVTGGLVSSTGIAGFTLGGGIGWLLRRHGLTCDNLVRADVVTADGRMVTADADEHPDLFWALRGGGGNFGVVTSFEYQLHPVGPTVLAGLLFFPGDAARDVLIGWRDLTAGLPDELTTLANLTTAPPVPFLPAEVHGSPIVALAAMWCGPLEQGEDAVRPLRELATPVADLVGPIPYTGMQSLLDPLWTKGAYNYFTSAMLDRLPDDGIDELLRRWETKPTPFSELHLHHAGGAMARVAPDATAFAQRSSPYVLNVIARAPDGTGFDGHVAWARATRTALSRFGSGASYVNFTSEAGEDKVRASYPPATYARLVGVKNRYDPTNLFRLNQNIVPSGGATVPSQAHA